MAFTITITVTDKEELYLKNDFLDPEAWIRSAVAGKIAQTKKRFINEWQAKVMADPEITTLPAEETAFANLIRARPDYKNRAQREADLK